MFEINLRGKKEKIYTVEDFADINIIKSLKTVLKKGKKKRRYFEDFLTFDIETSTIKPLSWLYDPMNSLEKPWSFMYVWQMCVNDYVFVGRSWGEFKKIMELIKRLYGANYHERLVVYVHNLAYEMQFLQSIIEIEELFAKDIRKPLSFYWNGFEFRCSYYLTNMSLEKFCENSQGVTHPKMNGEDFDYSVIRYPDTDLSEVEWGYVFCDVKGLHESIEFKLKEDTIATIPLTSTGYVRREMRKLSRKYTSSRARFLRQRLTLEQLKLIMKVMRGGDTHASRFYAGCVVKNLDSFDFKSSYPFVLMADYYPYGPFQTPRKISTRKELNNLCKTKCVIMNLDLFDVHIKDRVPAPYIDFAHCEKRKSVVCDNGRILDAEYINISITEIDWEIIQEQYNIGSVGVVEIYYAHRGFIDEYVREAIMEYFRIKSELDGVEGKEYEYAKSKNLLNSIYGMMLTAMVHPQVILENGQWKKEEPDFVEGLQHYYDSHNSFLSFQNGIYVTAHARKRLNLIRTKAGTSAIYWDTDSLKFEGNQDIYDFIESYNQEIRNYGFYAEDLKGRKIYLGVMEKEEPYEEFKTLGAKKYIVRKHGEYEITVAGMNKKKGIEAVKKYAMESGKDVMEAFDIGVEYHDVGRTVAYYHDKIEWKIIDVDGHKVEKISNIGIVESTYRLGVTNEYFEIILDNIIEQQPHFTKGSKIEENTNVVKGEWTWN